VKESMEEEIPLSFQRRNTPRKFSIERVAALNSFSGVYFDSGILESFETGSNSEV